MGLVAHRQEHYSRCLQQVSQQRREGKELSCWGAEEMKCGFKSQELDENSQGRTQKRAGMN